MMRASRLTLCPGKSVLKFFRRTITVAEEKIKHRASKFSVFKILQPKTTHEYTEPRFRVEMPTRYGGSNTVTVIPGAGIGPELWDGVKQVMLACRAPLVFDEIDMKPADDVEKCNEDFVHGLMAIRRNGVALKGGIESHACDPADYSRNVALRRNLDLYANVIEYKSYPGVNSKFKDIDLVIVRQNSEGEYLMLEHEPTPGVIQNMKVVTEFNSERTARFAFNYAVKYKRKRVTVTHRAHIMPLADGMFADSVERVAKEFPQIEFQQKTIAHVVKRLSRDPNQFDMIVCTNLSGSMITNIMMGVVGSPALMSGKNYGDDVAVFETGRRNKCDSLAGKGVANPTAFLNAGVDMLHYLGHSYHACLIREAIDMTINVDKVHTLDLGGNARTQDVIDNVICRLRDVEASKCPVPETKDKFPSSPKKEDKCAEQESEDKCCPEPEDEC